MFDKYIWRFKSKEDNDHFRPVEGIDFQHRKIFSKDYSIPFEKIEIRKYTGIDTYGGNMIFEGFRVWCDEICFSDPPTKEGLVRWLEGSWVIDTGSEIISLWDETHVLTLSSGSSEDKNYKILAITRKEWEMLYGI